MLGRIACIAILACVSSAFADSPTETIPLKDIWAKDMPGTKDVKQLDADLSAHTGTPGIFNEPANGFAVLGSGLDALKAAHAVLHDGKNPQSIFTTSDEISVVFFSYEFGAFVHLKTVERTGNTLTVSYSFFPHTTRYVTQHYALIPIGKLPKGTYNVNFVQLPMSGPDAPPSATIDKPSEKYICKPFSFSVVEK